MLIEEPPAKALEQVRGICDALAGASETTSFGHPTWKVKKKSFYVTPYLGQKGWVSFKLQGRIPWTRLRALLREAHLLAS
jgi:predicted DNA-binding protein (MmcQ/YjbR family)